MPVTCGSALRNTGVQPLIEAIGDYLPSPLDVPAVTGMDYKDGDPVTREPAKSEPFAALAFKAVADPFIGRLVYFRVYSGKADSGSMVFNATNGRRERLGRVVRLHAQHREDLEEVKVGDIAAAVGLKRTSTGDTLCDEREPVVLETITFPEPVMSVAIEAKTRADQDRLADALSKMADEDPTLRVSHDDEVGQTVMSGMGELHLEIVVDRMKREYKVSKATWASPGSPSGRRYPGRAGPRDVSFGRRAGTDSTATSGSRSSRWSAVRASCSRRISRAERSEGVHLSHRERCVQDAAAVGPISGFPVVDMKVTAVDGSYHEVDSSEMAFRIAGVHGRQGGDAQGQARRSWSLSWRWRWWARRVPGRDTLRAGSAPRRDSRNRGQRRHPGRESSCAAERELRLRDRAPLDNSGASGYTLEFESYGKTAK